MAWHPDPLLLELFEFVQKKLSDALEARERLTPTPPGVNCAALTAVETRKITYLKGALAALRGALEGPRSVIVH